MDHRAGRDLPRRHAIDHSSLPSPPPDALARSTDGPPLALAAQHHPSVEHQSPLPPNDAAGRTKISQAVTAGLARSAGPLVLHLLTGWPWETTWTQMAKTAREESSPRGLTHPPVGQDTNQEQPKRSQLACQVTYPCPQPGNDVAITLEPERSTEVDPRLAKLIAASAGRPGELAREPPPDLPVTT